MSSWTSSTAAKNVHSPDFDLLSLRFAISQWLAAMLAEGTGRESARRAMVLLQAMFAVAVEWWEVEINPVALVRKPRQGRDHTVRPLTPAAVETIRAEILDVGDRRSATLTTLMAYAGVALGLEARHVRGTTVLVEVALSDGDLKRQKTNRRTGRLPTSEPFPSRSTSSSTSAPDARLTEPPVAALKSRHTSSATRTRA